MTSTVQLVTHAVVALALIGAYTALTVLGHDGTPVLGALAGYLGAAAVGNAPTKPGP